MTENLLGTLVFKLGDSFGEGQVFMMYYYQFAL
jgi:hypothetical protein